MLYLLTNIKNRRKCVDVNGFVFTWTPNKTEKETDSSRRVSVFYSTCLFSIVFTFTLNYRIAKGKIHGCALITVKMARG